MASSSAFAGTIPKNYETFLAPIFFEPYSRHLAEAFPFDGNHLLELACGTGRLTAHLTHRLAPEGKIIATDNNAAMLHTASLRVKDPRIAWQLADAQDLPFGDAAFDRVACQFGFMFFPDKIAAFAEAARVLQRGGWLCFNTWDELRHNALSHWAQEVLHSFCPYDPPEVQQKGPYSFFDPVQIKTLLHATGFGSISIETVPLMGYAPTADDAVNGIIDGTPNAVYLAQRGMPAQPVKEKLKALLVAHYGDRQLALPMQALICKARKM